MLQLIRRGFNLLVSLLLVLQPLTAKDFQKPYRELTEAARGPQDPDCDRQHLEQTLEGQDVNWALAGQRIAPSDKPLQLGQLARVIAANTSGNTHIEDFHGAELLQLADKLQQLGVSEASLVVHDKATNRSHAMKLCPGADGLVIEDAGGQRYTPDQLAQQGYATTLVASGESILNPFCQTNYVENRVGHPAVMAGIRTAGPLLAAAGAQLANQWASLIEKAAEELERYLRAAPVGAVSLEDLRDNLSPQVHSVLRYLLQGEEDRLQDFWMPLSGPQGHSALQQTLKTWLNAVDEDSDSEAIEPDYIIDPPKEEGYNLPAQPDPDQDPDDSVTRMTQSIAQHFSLKHLPAKTGHEKGNKFVFFDNVGKKVYVRIMRYSKRRTFYVRASHHDKTALDLKGLWKKYKETKKVIIKKKEGWSHDEDQTHLAIEDTPEFHEFLCEVIKKARNRDEW